jgi:hypothetical protein
LYSLQALGIPVQLSPRASMQPRSTHAATSSSAQGFGMPEHPGGGIPVLDDVAALEDTSAVLALVSAVVEVAVVEVASVVLVPVSAAVVPLVVDAPPSPLVDEVAPVPLVLDAPPSPPCPAPPVVDSPVPSPKSSSESKSVEHAAVIAPNATNVAARIEPRARRESIARELSPIARVHAMVRATGGFAVALSLAEGGSRTER